MVEYLQNIFKNNNNSEIQKLYDLYRGEFITYTRKRFDIDENIISDIYQDAFACFYENIRDKKLTILTSSIKTYVFRIGINQTYKHLGKEKPFDRIEMYDNLYLNCDDDESTEWLEMQDIVYQTVKEMQEPCNTVLTLFYWGGNSMKEIAAKMNYKNEMVAKNRKSLCLKTIKEIIKQKIEKL